MQTLNLGILAHVDAGKTTLTERLLFEAGAIERPGSVDDGTTRTDTLDLERQRGITIRAAVASLVVGGLHVNIIDTPGHPDFIAEVERALAVLDGAVLVVSAVEGVQSQTRILMRALRRLEIPTLLFVNKVDRAGADIERVLDQVTTRLDVPAILVSTVDAAGMREASVRERHPAGDADFAASVAETLAGHDEALLAAYVEGGNLSPRTLARALERQSRAGLVHPVFAGSAATGAGVASLLAALPRLLPRAAGDAADPFAGDVFKIERGPAGEKIVYLRTRSGVLRVRDRVALAEGGERVTALEVFAPGGAVWADEVLLGQVAKVWGLAGVRVGQRIGAARLHPGTPAFAPPALETVVTPRDPSQRHALRVALGQLADQDPLINLRQDDEQQQLSLSLYGEVQKEVIEATLASDYAIAVDFHESTTICVERPAGTGAAVEVMRDGVNPFLATVGLRIEPLEPGRGVEFVLDTPVLGTMPFAFFRAVEDAVRETLHQGLFAWEVIDCRVTMTHSGYAPRQSHAHQRFSKAMSSTGADFRGLTPLVLMAALAEAGTVVCEPVHHFVLETPSESLGMVYPALARCLAVPGGQLSRGAETVIEGDIPSALVRDLQQMLPGLTHGAGAFESSFDRFEPVSGPAPSRRRAGPNPLDRKEYLLRLARRTSMSRDTEAVLEGASDA